MKVRKDYALTLDTAKKVAMSEQTTKWFKEFVNMLVEKELYPLTEKKVGDTQAVTDAEYNKVLKN